MHEKKTRQSHSIIKYSVYKQISHQPLSVLNAAKTCYLPEKIKLLKILRNGVNYKNL